jgi:hypothetical protein
MTNANTLRARVPGQSVMGTVVTGQLTVPPRSPLARVFGATPLSRANRILYRSAVIELLVGDALDGLGPAWDVLHAVPLGSGAFELDHVAIGPPGVFVVVVCNESGLDVIVDGHSMFIDGAQSDELRRATATSSVAADLLGVALGQKVDVRTLVVVVDPKKLVIRASVEGIDVVSAQNLVRWMTRLDRQLDGPGVAMISDVADRSSTWRTDAAQVAEADLAGDGEDAQQLHEQFVRLRHQVAVAARIRAIWAGLAFVVVCSVLWAGAAIAVSHMFAL